MTTVCDERFFSKIHDSFPQTSVHVPNGNDTSITKISNVSLSPSIILKNVLLILDFQFNLISVSKLCEDNFYRVFFDSDMCSFQALSIGKLIGLGNIREGLYFWTTLPKNLDISSFPLNKGIFCNANINNNIFVSH